MADEGQKADEVGDPGGGGAGGAGGGGTPPRPGDAPPNKKKQQSKPQSQEAAAFPPAKARPQPGRKKGPTVTEQILHVAAATKERRGISLAALKKALSAKGYDVNRNNTRVNRTVKQLVRNGSLVQTSGVGASGSFRFNRTGAGGAAAAGGGPGPRRERRAEPAKRKRAARRKSPPPLSPAARRRAAARRKAAAKCRRPVRRVPRRPAAARRRLHPSRRKGRPPGRPPLKGVRLRGRGGPAAPYSRGRPAISPRLYRKYKPVRSARSPPQRGRPPGSRAKRQRRAAVRGTAG